MSSITIYLTNSSGVPLSGQTVKLRRAGLDNFGTDYLTMVDVAGKPGKYKTVDDYVSDRYKVWVNAAEDESFGGPDGLEITKQSDILLKSGGTMTGVINMNGQKLTNLPSPTDNSEPATKGWSDTEKLAKSGGTISGNLTMGGFIGMGSNKITDLGDATAAKDALNRDSGDARYALIDDTNIFTMLQRFAEDVVFQKGVSFSSECPTTDNDPVNEHGLVRRAFLDARLAELVITPYQQSINLIRCMQGQIQETGKCYPTLAQCLIYCGSFATSDWRWIIEIMGGGEDTRDVPVMNWVSNVSIKGGNQNVRLLVDDNNYTCTAESVIIENLRIFRDDDGTGTPSFTNTIFKDCYLDFDTASLTFINCTFRGYNVVKNTGTITYDGDTKGPVMTNRTLGSKMLGYGELNLDQL